MTTLKQSINEAIRDLKHELEYLNDPYIHNLEIDFERIEEIEQEIKELNQIKKGI